QRTMGSCRDAGTIHENVYPTECGQDGLNEVRNARAIREVYVILPSSATDALGYLLELFALPIDKRHRCAGLGKQNRCLPADPGCSSGYKCNLAREGHSGISYFNDLLFKYGNSF